MTSPYIVQRAHGTTCGVCKRPARMLVREDGTINPHNPAFYLCQCGYVGQIGVGPVLGSLKANQEDYDEIVAAFGRTPVDRTGTGAMALHERVMRVMNGNEPDPRR